MEPGSNWKEQHSYVFPLCFFVHESADGAGPLFSYLIPSSSFHRLALPKLVKLESPAFHTNLHFLETCGLRKHYLCSV